MSKEILIIEKEAFESLLSRLEALNNKVTKLHKKYKSKQLGEPLDGNQVCDILNIKPRTLQTYRDTGRIGFSQIGRKIYYRVNDVDKLLKDSTMNKKNSNSNNPLKSKYKWMY